MDMQVCIHVRYHTRTHFSLQESYSSDNQSYVHNAAAKLTLLDELLNQQRGFWSDLQETDLFIKL